MQDINITQSPNRHTPSPSDEKDRFSLDGITDFVARLRQRGRIREAQVRPALGPQLDRQLSGRGDYGPDVVHGEMLPPAMPSRYTLRVCYASDGENEADRRAGRSEEVGSDVAEGVPDPEGNEVVVWGENGRLLVTGQATAVDAFLETFEPARSLDVGAARGVADGAAALSAVHGISSAGARYVELTGDSAAKLAQYGAQRDSAGAIYGFVRDSSGKFAGNLKGNPVSLAGSRATSVQFAVAAAALRLAIQETQDAVEDVAADVDQLRRLTEAAEIGNVAGLYRILANARRQVDQTGVISQATWDAIAVHEVTAQQGADRARALVRHILRDMPLGADAGERTEAADRLVSEQTLTRTLRLLLLAEQCRLLYRSLKLDQVRRAEPEALDGEITAAQRLLVENATADRELIDQLHDTVNRLGRTGPLDGVRLFTRRKLPRLITALQEEVEHFARQRQQQLESWAPTTTPRVADALKEVAGRVYGGALAGRNQLGGLLEQVGRRLQGEERQQQPSDDVDRDDDR